jgi:DsbC/DsbD-like thiol-disulfide interchange protein
MNEMIVHTHVLVAHPHVHTHGLVAHHHVHTDVVDEASFHPSPSLFGHKIVTLVVVVVVVVVVVDVHLSFDTQSSSIDALVFDVHLCSNLPLVVIDEA